MTQKLWGGRFSGETDADFFAFSESFSVYHRLALYEIRVDLAYVIELQDAGISADYVTDHGSPEQVVTRVAEERDIDLIVMGTHGRTGLAHLALGSVACRVVQNAPCSVLTVKGDAA